MRVVINRESAGGLKTGVGHYTGELLRCLREQADEDRIDGYPHAWMWRARKLWAGVSPHLEGPRSAAATVPVAQEASPVQPGVLGSARAGLMGRLRTAGKVLRDRHYRAHFASKAYDLYHEPNHIP